MDDKNYALRVLVSGNDEQRHAAFLLTDQAESEVIHLAWHKYLMKQTVPVFKANAGEFIDFECRSFSEYEQEEIISFIKVLWRRNSSAVPYSIMNDGTGSFFNLDGTMPTRDAGMGLTCATFVMSVFSIQGFPLIDESTWQARPEDKKWHEKIISKLKEIEHIDPQHIENQIKYIGIAPRFRPEEVIGCAADYNNEPQNFCGAIGSGEKVLRIMREAGLLAN